MKIHNYGVLLLLFFYLFVTQVHGQQSLVFVKNNKAYFDGLELYQKQKYGVAQEKFREALAMKETDEATRTESEFYAAMCALNLYNKDAEYLISNFISAHLDSRHVSEAGFSLAKYYYQNKRYKTCIDYFEKVNRESLNPDELTELKFKLGYSYFTINNYDKALPLFNEVKAGESEYSNAALYYFSHISYMQNNYQTALNGFQKLAKDEMFSPIIPYYIAQIYYEQKDYEKIISFLPSLIETSTPKRKPEIARILGEAYYKTQRYKEAIPYLELYKSDGNSFSHDDGYVLAYSYYQSGDYKNAAKLFESLTSAKDAMAQNAYYHLADCYLHLGERTKAQMAFSSAANLEFDQAIKEDALFNYAKLTYESSYSPFNETIKAFNDFITLFPKSENIDEAYDYLIKVYMSTKNYKDALVFLEKIVRKDVPQSKSIRTAYQRVAYFRGLELFSNLNFDDAIACFNKSLQYSNFNPAIKALTLYWKAEAYYRQYKYEEAADLYKDFIHSPGTIDLEEFREAHYALGYCYFSKKDYTESLSWFKKFIAFEPVKASLKGDACLRIADCYFTARNFQDAIKYYDLAIDNKVTDADYAMFQKGFSLGLQKNNLQKINVLRKLISTEPASGYVDDAIFELGKTYVALDSSQKAIEEYNRIIKDFPGSSYVLKSYLQLGMIYYNANNDDEALKIYKQVISTYPGTPEAKNALLGIKNIYIDLHEEDQYFDYAKTLGSFADIRQTEQDSLSYLSGEKLYMSGDCDKSTEHFGKYISKFPDGNFVLNAYYYKAKCELKAGNEGEAMKSLAYIISKPKNMFTEDALLNSAGIHYSHEKYSEAAKEYSSLESIAENKSNLLEARTGLMRSYYILKMDSAAILAANSLILTDKVPDELVREAHYVCAKSYYSIKNFESALNEFRILAKNTTSKEGAEAKYYVAQIYFDQSKIDLAQKEILEFNGSNTPHQFWLAKAIVLLADIYLINGDKFQAKQTLESVINNYEITTDGIIDAAKAKLNLIIKQEEDEKILKMKKQQQMELEEENDLNNTEKEKSDTIPVNNQINKVDSIVKPEKK